MGIIEERHGAPCRTARAANERRRPSSPPAFFPDNRGSRRTPDRPPERNVKEKENMPRTPAKKSKAATAAHPPYVSMVKEAIVALKDRTGSSTVAIAKYMKATYSLPENFTTTLSRFLKKYVESGELVKVKASYKLGTLKNEPKKKVVKKKVVKKKVVKKKKPTTTKAPKKKIAKKPKKAAPKKKKAPKKKTTKKR